MIIDNPNSYFVNTVFAKSGKLNLKSDKNQVVIVDFDYINNLDDIDKYFDYNIYLIILSTNYDSYSGELYSFMRKYKSTLLINKKDNLQLLQKRLFNKIIKNNLDDICNKEDYIKLINSKEIDVNNIIIKSGQLKYN